MGEIAEKLAELSITVSSPDGQLEANMQGGEPRSLVFQPGAYERYTEAELGDQLALTATLLCVGHDRGVQNIVEGAGLRRPQRSNEAVDEAGRQYLEEVLTTHATGTGSQQMVRFAATGLMDWRCEIVDGTIGYLSESQFLAEAVAAMRELLKDYRSQAALLRYKHHGSSSG